MGMLGRKLAQDPQGGSKDPGGQDVVLELPCQKRKGWVTSYHTQEHGLLATLCRW